MDSSLEIRAEKKGAVEVVRLDGRLDASTTPAAEKQIFAIIDGGSHQIVLDCEKLDYLSSAGMRLLFATLKKLRALQGKLVVCGLMEEVLEVVKMAGFESLLDIQNDEAKALARF